MENISVNEYKRYTKKKYIEIKYRLIMEKNIIGK